MDLTLFLQTVLNSILIGMIAMLVALGLSLIYGIMHIMNFMHGELYMLGGFGIWFFFAQHPFFGARSALSFVVAMIISMILVAILGIILERTLLRRFRGQLLQSFVICLGLILFLQAGALVSFGIDEKGARTPFAGVVKAGGVVLSKERLILVIIAAIMVAAVYFYIQRFRHGRAMRAVAQDPDAAALQGVSIDTVSSLCMSIGCALAAAAGCLVGSIFWINPYMGSEQLTRAFVVVILGGMGSIGGTIIGALVVGFVESFGTAFFGPEMALILIFAVLIVVLIVRPTGLFGVYYK